MKNIDIKTNFFLGLIIFSGILFLNAHDVFARAGDPIPVTDIMVDGEYTISINENLTSETSIGTITSNGDQNPTTYAFTCSTLGVDDEHFQINVDQLEVATVLDFENPVDTDTDNSYEICIRSTDGNSATFDQNITVTITDVADTTIVEKKSPKKSSSRRLSRTAVNQLFGTSVATPTTTTTPSPSSSTVTQIQTQIISLLTQLIAALKG